jgi:O-6-methylguanine DNA methyltransferase
MIDILDTKVIKTPVGSMKAVATQHGLCALEFMTDTRQALLDSRLSRWFSVEQVRSSQNSYIEEACSWLDFYFNGEFSKLFSIKMDVRGTAFEMRVWAALQQIPSGETISYSELATKVGAPKAPRAAGGASRRNPMSILIPCHRVFGIRGSLTGYGGGLDRKGFLINHESSAISIFD